MGTQVASDVQCFIPDIVLCELVWVLQASYKIPRARVYQLLSDLIRARHLLFQSPDRLCFGESVESTIPLTNSRG